MGEYCFIVYPIVSTLARATIVRSKMPNMSHDLDDMANKINSKTKVVFLANPNNPTGSKVQRGELESFQVLHAEPCFQLGYLGSQGRRLLFLS